MDPLVENLKALVPSVPPADAAYISRSAPGGPEWAALEDLRINIQTGQKFRWLLHGCVGVGKTTELLRWAAVLGNAAAYTPISQPARVADNKSDERFLGDPFHRTGIQPGDSRVALIDGLDLLNYEDTLRLFGPGSSFAGSQTPSMVVAVSHLVAAVGREARDERFDRLVHVPPFQVVTRDGDRNESVVRHLAAGLSKRLPHPDAVPGDVLDAVAFWSGGIPRDAVRILRGALVAAVRSKAALNAMHVQEGLREVRQDLEQGLDLADRLELETSGGRHAPSNRLLVLRGAVIPYEDADGRYWSLHPLLYDAFGREPG